VRESLLSGDENFYIATQDHDFANCNSINAIVFLQTIEMSLQTHPSIDGTFRP
jgi:hypothetical protein